MKTRDDSDVKKIHVTWPVEEFVDRAWERGEMEPG
jgi:hypothetical protein